MAATIVTSHPDIHERLMAQYRAWQAAGEPRIIERYTRPFAYRVRIHDGYVVGEAWDSYRISLQGVAGTGDQLRVMWTTRLRKHGGLGAMRGTRPDSRQCYDAYEAWRAAGQPAEFVYLG